MKLIKLLTISALTFTLLTATNTSLAKEQKGHQKSESRKVVVNSSNKSSTEKNHHSSQKSSHKNSHKVRTHQSHKKYHNSHKRHHNNYNTHKRYTKRHYNIGKAIIAGAALHYALGPHGRYYNGHAWCPTHYLYHTHGFSIYSDYHHSHSNYQRPRKVETFIELDDGMCYKVTEYSNGDQKRKRIRDYHCDEIDEWDDWEE